MEGETLSELLTRCFIIRRVALALDLNQANNKTMEMFDMIYTVKTATLLAHLVLK